jgi:hypothetical protein
VQINMSHLTLQPWLLSNHTMVMIICMLVMVRDFPLSHPRGRTWRRDDPRLIWVKVV